MFYFPMQENFENRTIQTENSLTKYSITTLKKNRDLM